MASSYKFLFAACISVLFTGCQVMTERMTPAEAAATNEKLWAELFSAETSIDQTISLPDAVARALKYNLDYQLKVLDQDIAREAHDISKLAMLPSLDAKSSLNRQNQTTVRGEKLDSATYELGATWNLLDFGVSYYQAKQKGNKALISSLKLQRSAHDLIKKTRSAYWRKIAADKFAERIGPLREKLQVAIESAQETERRRLQPPLEILDTQKSFLELLIQLNQLEKSLSTAEYELAKLIRVNPFQGVEVIHHDTNQLFAKFQYHSPEKLIKYALSQRDDLLIKDYEKRIAEDESKKTLLKLLPGLTFNLAEKYNSNVTYENNYWNEVGLRLSWNLLNLLHLPKQQQMNEYQKQRKHLEHLAMMVSVITQVQISQRRTIDAWNNYHSLQNISEVGDRIYNHATAVQSVASLTELDLIKREADSVIYEVKQYLGYAELEEAAADFYYSLGAKVIPENLDQLDVEQISEFLKQHYLKNNVVSMHTAVDIPLDVVTTEWVAQ